ncbi:MAG: hypothetical protein PHY73_02340 [Candidatus Omnitrophica bacterium]|nr:hypothetical protein [Candidatus Omnitrophota bacterium]
MKELEINKKLRFWQIIVLIQLILVIFLGLLVYAQKSDIISQKTYISVLQNGIAVRDQNTRILSKRLVAAMTLLQSAAQEITQGGALTQEGAVGQQQ